MNTYEQLVGKQIQKVVRIDTLEDYSEQSLLAVFLYLECDSGLLCGVDFKRGITLDYRTELDAQYDYGVEYSETFWNKLRPDDSLRYLEGQTIREVRIGEFRDKLSGKTFVVKPSSFAGISLQLSNGGFTFFNSEAGAQFLFSSDIHFPNPKDWTLK